jgi:hypothetical protein
MAAQILFWENLFRIFGIASLQCVVVYCMSRLIGSDLAGRKRYDGEDCLLRASIHATCLEIRQQTYSIRMLK